MQSLWLILQLLFCLACGFFFARKLPQPIIHISFKVLPWFSYLLLIAIAFEFADVLHQIPQPFAILGSSIGIALSTTLGSFLCCYAIFKCLGVKLSSGQVSLQLLMHSLKNIGYAFVALMLGYLLFKISTLFQLNLSISTWYLLLIFMILIGLDLAYSPLDRSWLNFKILLVPISAIFGSIAAVIIYAQFSHHLSIKDLLLLSQGYGFYSMSGVVISELRGAELGTIALINDLFREIFAILLMYCLGWRYPRAAISAAGATAMDVTLPMVKESCGNDFIPHAMVSGFVLSVLAPIMVSVLAAI